MNPDYAPKYEPLSDSEIRVAVAAELFPVFVAILAVVSALGLWAYYSATGFSLEPGLVLFLYGVLAVVFLFSGFGWTLVGRSGVGCAMILLRLAIAFVSLPIAGVTATGDVGAVLSVAVLVSGAAGILVSIGSAVAIARTERRGG